MGAIHGMTDRLSAPTNCISFKIYVKLYRYISQVLYSASRLQNHASSFGVFGGRPGVTLVSGPGALASAGPSVLL